MSEILTIAGISELYRLKKSGKPLPADYKELISDYLKCKKSAVDKFDRDWDKSQYQLALLMARYILEGKTDVK